ncbi:MAG: lipopolysaccharide biosynthesis protein [Chryseobacterium sp.]|nr:MAG: lipopolysaccharide biosynthesis protein [Chryseobacterium sp.]
MLSEHQIKNNQPGSDITFKQIISKLDEWRSALSSAWLAILIGSFIGGAVGIAYSIYKKPIYIASTSFVLEEEKNGGGLNGLAGLASAAGVDLGGGGGGIFQGDNILGLYKSRAMLQKTLLTPINGSGSRELLVQRYLNFNKLNEKWAKNKKLADFFFSNDSAQNINNFLRSSRLRDSVLGDIVIDINKNYLAVGKPDKKLSAIQVDVKASDEVFAKSFNDQLVKNVNEFYIDTKTKKTLQNVKILQNKTDSVRSVMNGAIYSSVAIADATPNLNPTRQIQRVAPAQKAQFSAETSKAILSEMVKNLELSKLSLLKETPLIQIIDYPIFPLEVKKFGLVSSFVKGFLLLMVLLSIFVVVRVTILKSLE